MRERERSAGTFDRAVVRGLRRERDRVRDHLAGRRGFLAQVWRARGGSADGWEVHQLVLEHLALMEAQVRLHAASGLWCCSHGALAANGCVPCDWGEDVGATARARAARDVARLGGWGRPTSEWTGAAVRVTEVPRRMAALAVTAR